MNLLEGLFEQSYQLFEQKKYELAIERLNIAENLLESADSETLVSFFNFKGFNFMGMRHLENARNCFVKSLNIDPASSQAYAGLGELLFLCERDNEAKSMYEQAVRNNPQNLFAINGLKKINKILGYEEGHTSFQPS